MISAPQRRRLARITPHTEPPGPVPEAPAFLPPSPVTGGQPSNKSRKGGQGDATGH